jgi:basic amino acid/polyamine antiporter, APA family
MSGVSTNQTASNSSRGTNRARKLGALSATLLVVGSMVGTGVFTTAGFLVRDLSSIPAVLALWVVGGVLAMAGALSYAELGAALPENGGEYQLLTRIYHPAVGFVSGWVSLVVGFSAPTAASALAFGAYVEAALPEIPAVAAALGLLIALAAAHAASVRLGSGVQNLTTIGLVLLAIGFVAVGLARADFGRALESSVPLGAALSSPSFAVGLVYVSFAYSGWNAAIYVAGEVDRPARALPLALIAGTLLVTLLYLALNFVFVTAAPASELAGKLEVGQIAAQRLFGAGAARVMSLLVALALATTVSALLMTGPRVYEAMGVHHPRLMWLSRRAGGGPSAAIALQAGLAAAMLLTAAFDQLLSYIGFTLAISSALAVAGVFVLRRREPSLPRPYRVLGHPVTPALAIAISAWMVIHALVERPFAALAGLATIATGLLAWALVRRPIRPRVPRV